MITDTTVRDRISGRAIVFHEDGVNTDRIIPSRYLKELTFDDLGKYVFIGDRTNATAAGDVHPFDAPENQGARILIAGANFGAGSSREAAPQALTRWGIDVIIAVSFGEIFRGNSAAIGVPCPTVDARDYERICARIAADPAVEVTMSLTDMTVSIADEQWPLQLNETQRAMFRSGSWDTLSLLLEGAEQARTVAARLPYLTGWR